MAGGQWVQVGVLVGAAWNRIGIGLAFNLPVICWKRKTPGWGGGFYLKMKIVAIHNTANGSVARFNGSFFNFMGVGWYGCMGYGLFGEIMGIVERLAKNRKKQKIICF